MSVYLFLFLAPVDATQQLEHDNVPSATTLSDNCRSNATRGSEGRALEGHGLEGHSLEGHGPGSISHHSTSLEPIANRDLNRQKELLAHDVLDSDLKSADLQRNLQRNLPASLVKDVYRNSNNNDNDNDDDDDDDDDDRLVIDL